MLSGITNYLFGSLKRSTETADDCAVMENGDHHQHLNMESADNEWVLVKETTEPNEEIVTSGAEIQNEESAYDEQLVTSRRDASPTANQVNVPHHSHLITDVKSDEQIAKQGSQKQRLLRERKRNSRNTLHRQNNVGAHQGRQRRTRCYNYKICNSSQVERKL